MQPQLREHFAASAAHTSPAGQSLLAVRVAKLEVRQRAARERIEALAARHEAALTAVATFDPLADALVDSLAKLDAHCTQLDALPPETRAGTLSAESQMLELDETLLQALEHCEPDMRQLDELLAQLLALASDAERSARTQALRQQLASLHTRVQVRSHHNCFGVLIDVRGYYTYIVHAKERVQELSQRVDLLTRCEELASGCEREMDSLALELKRVLEVLPPGDHEADAAANAPIPPPARCTANVERLEVLIRTFTLTHTYSYLQRGERH